MKIKQLLLAAAAMVFAVACNETPDEPGVTPTPEVQVSVLPNTLSVAYTGAENSVLVNAKGAWTATADADWITVEPASGEAGAVQVKVTVAKSDVAEARTGKVVFAVGEEKAELTVEQQAAPEAGSEVWGIAGSHQNWAPADAPAMEYADGYYAVKGWEVEANTEFKFVKDNAWTVNRGYSGSKPMTANYFYAVEHDGGNIKVLTAGTYDIYLNADASVFYLMEAGKLPAEAQDSETLEDAVVPDADKGWRVVGTHNGWNKDGEDVNMTLSNGLWAATGVTMDKTDEGSGLVEFKFVQDRDWNKAVGVDNDAELAVNCFYAAGGSNIKVATGTYDLYLSEDATKFYVMAAGVDPKTAQDATGGGDDAEVTASISDVQVAEGRMGYDVTFTLTTANVTAAAYNYWLTEDVESMGEDLTADYLFELAADEMAVALEAEELNTEISQTLRGLTSGNYTIVVAYKDAEGNAAMTTATVTVGEAGGEEEKGYFIYEATSATIFVDDVDAMETEFTVTDANAGIAVTVALNTTSIVMDALYYDKNTNEEMGDDASTEYVTYAAVRDAATGSIIEVIGFVSFSVWDNSDGTYGASIYGMTETEALVDVMYSGTIEGLGGGGGAVIPEYYQIEANSYDLYADDLAGESIFTLFSDVYDVVLFINNDKLALGEEYSFVVEPGTQGITSAIVKDHKTGDTLENITSGTFGIYQTLTGEQYTAFEFVSESGVEGVAEYFGEVSGIGGSSAVPAEFDFVVASAKLVRAIAYTDDPSAWDLELTSTDGKEIVITIDTGDDESGILNTNTYNVLTAYQLNGTAGIGMYDSYFPISANGSWMIADPENSYLKVDTKYPTANETTLDGVFVLGDAATGAKTTMTVKTEAPLALYESLPEGGDDTEEVKVIRFDVDTDLGDGEFYNGQNYLASGYPIQSFVAGVGDDTIALGIYDYQYLPQYGCLNDFYPVVASDINNMQMSQVSGVGADSYFTYFVIDGVFYSVYVPEEEANGERYYGVTVESAYLYGGMDMNYVYYYLPAVDDEGNKVIVDGVYTGPIGLAPMTTEIDFSLSDFGFSKFTQTVSGKYVTLISQSQNGNFKITIKTEDGATIASEDGIAYSIEDGNLSGYYWDAMDDVDFNFVAGGFTLFTTETAGTYTLTVSRKNGFTLKDADGKKQYNVLTQDYTITVE